MEKIIKIEVLDGKAIFSVNGLTSYEAIGLLGYMKQKIFLNIYDNQKKEEELKVTMHNDNE